MQGDSLCMRCMEPKDGPVCARCGLSEDMPLESVVALPPGTVLKQQYLLGRVLGSGGFGITYIALDLTLKWKLAIKEYYPCGFGARAPDQHTITPVSSHFKTAFDSGLQRFMQEGQALARFQHHPGVVSVVTLFQDNGTAYLVMRYEEGISFKEYLIKRGGRLDFPTTRNIVMRLMDTLRAIHGGGVLHRDISPENIFINESGQVKLLDFGAAKHDMASRERSLQVTVKRGYSPVEQYSDTPGQQGAWTDVYALAATAYRAMTGETPPESVSRREADRDPLEAPSRLGVRMPVSAEKALMRALAILPAARFRTMKEFQESFAAEETIHPWWRKSTAVPVGALCVLLLLFLTLWLGTPTVTFTADRDTITPGQSAVLQWSVGRGSVSIAPDVGARHGRTGRIEVSPANTTRYALTARGLFRKSTRYLTVAVARPTAPAVRFFKAENPVIDAGAKTELSWSVDGDPVRVTILPEIGAVKSAGRISVGPGGTTTYTLRAETPGFAPAELSTTLTVRRAVPGPEISTFRASPSNIESGDAATLEWNVTGDSRNVVLRSRTDGDPGGERSETVGPSGRRKVRPRASTTYTLVATGSDGAPVTTSTALYVAAARPVSRGQASRGESGDSSSGASPLRVVKPTDPPPQPASPGQTGNTQVQPEFGTVTIELEDETGQPLADAMVEVSSPFARTVRRRTQAGSVEYTGPIGEYTLKVWAQGYQPEVRKINVMTVQNGQWPTVPVRMRK